MYKNIIDNIDDRDRRKWVGDRVERQLDLQKRSRDSSGKMKDSSYKSAIAMSMIFKEAKKAGEVKNGVAYASDKTMRKIFSRIDQVRT